MSSRSRASRPSALKWTDFLVYTGPTWSGDRLHPAEPAPPPLCVIFLLKKEEEGGGHREQRTPPPPTKESASSEWVPDGLPRRDGSVEPHEGPQRRPPATIGVPMHVCISWTDWLESCCGRWLQSFNQPVEPPHDGEVEDSRRPPRDGLRSYLSLFFFFNLFYVYKGTYFFSCLPA